MDAIVPREEDVSSLDGIIAAFYDVISGPAGAERDWARDSTLYVPGALFVPTRVHPAGKVTFHVLDQQGYAKKSDAYFKEQGFFEKEIHRITRSFGLVTHVFSTYEFRYSPDGPVAGRGVNSIQLVYDKTRWWIVSAAWDSERDGNPVTDDFLSVKYNSEHSE